MDGILKSFFSGAIAVCSVTTASNPTAYPSAALQGKPGSSGTLDCSPMRQKIIERFEITGRGTTVVVPDPTNLPVGRPLKASIIGPDGSRLDAEAFKEWLLRRTPEPIEHEAYLLREISKSQIPDGASIEIEPI